jgi:hypothetical protein
MAYCAQADIEKTIGFGLGEEPETKVYEHYLELTSDQIARCIERADNEINMYLSSVATTPFSTVPTMVKEISVLLAGANALDSGRTDYVVREVGSMSEEMGRIPMSSAYRAEANRKLTYVKENAASLLGTAVTGGTAAGTPLHNEPTFSFTTTEMDKWV